MHVYRGVPFGAASIECRPNGKDVELTAMEPAY